MTTVSASQVQSVRRIPTKRGSLSGEMNIARFSDSIPYESGLERDFVRVTAIDTDVSGIVSQPCRIGFMDLEGKSRRYTPDYLVTFEDRNSFPLLVEVKYADELKSKAKEFQPKFDAARIYAAEQGWQFSVFTEIEIRTPKLDNARTLLPLQSRKPNPGLCARLLRKISSGEKVSISGLLDRADLDGLERARGRNTVFSLIAHGVLSTDLAAEITENSFVRREMDGGAYGDF